jgi:hypothetical protein
MLDDFYNVKQNDFCSRQSREIEGSVDGRRGSVGEQDNASRPSGIARKASKETIPLGIWTGRSRSGVLTAVTWFFLF